MALVFFMVIDFFCVGIFYGLKAFAQEYYTNKAFVRNYDELQAEGRISQQPGISSEESD